MIFRQRKPELAFLRKQYETPEASMIVVYGRRRTGKTALLKEFTMLLPHIYFLATEENILENRKNFQNTVYTHTGNPLPKTSSVQSWEALFDQAAPAGLEQKVVVILDEFQNLGVSDPSFPSLLQKIWDTTLRERNILLILCGSVIPLMERMTISDSSPLQGRQTGQIRLGPIPFRQYSDFYPRELPFQQMMEYYSITGGIPRYIEIILYKGIPRSTEELLYYVLEKDRYLYDEPRHLLQQEVRDIGPYFSLLKCIAAGNRKVSKIGAVLDVQQSSLAKPLKTLCDLDLIRRQVPVTETNPERSKQGQYRIPDPFFSFWFRFVYPNQSRLEWEKQYDVRREILSRLQVSHTALIFKDVCLELIQDLVASGFFPIQYTDIGRWWGRQNAEIDIVALGQNSILFGECKYLRVKPVGIDLLYNLRRKAANVVWGDPDRNEAYALFSVSGFTMELRVLAESDPNLHLFDFSAGFHPEQYGLN